ncbi:AMP-binding protein [bacterium]|nr:AMP-binding protein [bacterium]
MSPRIPVEVARSLAEEADAHWYSPTTLNSEILGKAVPPELELNSPATAVLTSGSSGQPTLVVHSIGNHVASARAVQARLLLQPTDVWSLSLPCFHVGGLAILWRCFLHGASVRILSEGQTVEQLLARTPPTILSLVPTQLQDLVSAGLKCPATVRDVIVGGAPISTSLLSAAHSLGYPVRTSYGLTETSSMVCLSDRWNASPHAGTPLPGVEVSLDGQGHLLVKSDSVCIGHLVGGIFAPNTATPFKTEDLATISTEGQLTILSRADEVIISGGENISLNEIRIALQGLKGVQECRVVSVAHHRYGQRPVAFVQAGPNTFDEEAFKQGLAAVLPSISIPDRILPMPRPEPDALKVTRSQLEQLAASFTKQAQQ